MPTMIEEEIPVENELDEKLNKMKRLPRGSFKPGKDATDLKNCKVKISMYLDADILEYFKKRAESSDAAPYQTQINNELRRVMENDSREIKSIENDILNNEEFLRALKEKLETLGKRESVWSKWQPMPNPAKCRHIDAPKNSGVYQIRNKQTGELILFGRGEECQSRMKSLYPEPYGVGTRDNEKKRSYVLDNWKNLEYRTMGTKTIDEAIKVERDLKAKKNHLFNT